MKLIMTKEEQEEFNLLPKEEQEAYVKEKVKKREDLMYQTTSLISLLDDKLDQMEEFGIYRADLKIAGKKFRSKLKVFIKRFRTVDISEEGALEAKKEEVMYVSQLSKQIDDLTSPE